MYDPAINLTPVQAEPACMRRIRKAKARVIDTRPSMDLENAVLLTESFRETEREPRDFNTATPSRKPSKPTGNTSFGPWRRCSFR